MPIRNISDYSQEELAIYREGLEDAAQIARYYLKHNEDRLDNTFPWEEASEYAKGFHIACHGVERAISDKSAEVSARLAKADGGVKRDDDR